MQSDPYFTKKIGFWPPPTSFHFPKLLYLKCNLKTKTLQHCTFTTPPPPTAGGGGDVTRTQKLTYGAPAAAAALLKLKRT